MYSEKTNELESFKEVEEKVNKLVEENNGLVNNISDAHQEKEKIQQKCNDLENMINEMENKFNVLL